MNIQFDTLTTTKFFEWIAGRFVEISIPKIQSSIEIAYSNDELLTRKEVCERILNCDENTGDKYFLYKSGFPYVEVGKGRRYPKRQVEEWIRNNTKFN